VDNREKGSAVTSAVFLGLVGCLSHLPLGLAKRDRLPPGLDRQFFGSEDSHPGRMKGESKADDSFVRRAQNTETYAKVLGTVGLVLKVVEPVEF
jgi:hypothetical protein